MTVHVQSLSPGNGPVLALNAEFCPLSYDPLAIRRRRDAIKAAFLDRVNILPEYDTLTRSPSFETVPRARSMNLRVQSVGRAMDIRTVSPNPRAADGVARANRLALAGGEA